MHSQTFRNLIIPVIFTVCAVESLRNDDIAKMLNNQAIREQIGEQLNNEYPSIDDINEFKERLNVIKNLDKEGDDMFEPVDNTEDGNAVDRVVSKRPFCNGFTGCGRIHGKRSSLSSPFLQKLSMPSSIDSDSLPLIRTVAKRPFCNGFFGCGNPGKRIVFRNSNFVNPEQYNSAEATAQKRVFCNGPLGCAHVGKRSPYRAWIERMRTGNMV